MGKKRPRWRRCFPPSAGTSYPTKGGSHMSVKGSGCSGGLRRREMWECPLRVGLVVCGDTLLVRACHQRVPADVASSARCYVRPESGVAVSLYIAAKQCAATRCSI